jgi:DNA-binding transcriptional MocR family regulator
MSVKVMGAIWDHVLAPSEQAVLLALADHAEHDGTGARPSVDRLAWKTALSSRTVQRVLHSLERRGVLVRTKAPGYHRAAEYRIVLSRLVRKAPFVSLVHMGDTTSPISPDQKGDTEREKGDSKGEKGDTGGSKGDTAMSPEPSVESSYESSARARDLRCAMAGCENRGYGPADLCVDHQYPTHAERIA